MDTIDLQKTSEEEVIARTLAVLRAGGLVIFPTETTYGAGVAAMNTDAVEKLLRYKARREGKPLSVAVATPEAAEHYVETNDSARTLYARFLPGPVTVISRGRHVVAPGVESEFGTLGIRIPDYPLILHLLAEFGEPVTSTSANASDAKRPYKIQDIFDGLSEKQKNLIDLVLDAGELPHRPPSTVIDTTLSTPVTFRQGDVMLETAAISPQLTLTSHSEQETREIAQRLLLKHWNDIKKTGLVIGLNGSLGMGKTIFVKGAAEFLQILDLITSPTYTYIEEYDFTRHQVAGKLFHLDAWKIDEPTELERLEFASLLQPNSVIVIEWISNVFPYVQKLLEEKGLPYLQVDFSNDPTNTQNRVLKIMEMPSSG